MRFEDNGYVLGLNWFGTKHARSPLPSGFTDRFKGLKICKVGFGVEPEFGLKFAISVGNWIAPSGDIGRARRANHSIGRDQQSDTFTVGDATVSKLCDIGRRLSRCVLQFECPLDFFFRT